MISQKATMNHLQHLLTHTIIKKLGVSRCKASKKARALLKYVEKDFVEARSWNTCVHTRLIVKDFNVGNILGFFDVNLLPADLNKLKNEIVWGKRD